MQKKVLVIQDISSIGKISQTVALPILSCLGLWTSLLPTALLSTHTEKTGYFFKSLSLEMENIIEHWSKLDVKFNFIQTGYLGDTNQVEIVKRALELSSDNTIKIIDPAMADNGVLYKGLDNNIIVSMKEMCELADIIIPNFTEAHLLLDLEYKDDYSKDYIQKLCYSLSHKFDSKVIITSVSTKKGFCGSACYSDGEFKIFETELLNSSYYGTGDLFASVLTGAIAREKNIFEAVDIATKYCYEVIKRTADSNNRKEDGILFEECVPDLLKLFGII